MLVVFRKLLRDKGGIPQSWILGDEDHAREFEMLGACYLFVGGVPDRGENFAFGFVGGGLQDWEEVCRVLGY